MFKIIFCIIILGIVITSGSVVYHLYQVKEKNKTELAAFDNEIPLNTDLGNVLIVYYSLTGHTKDIALQIKEKTNGKLYEISTVKEYSSPSVYLESKKELSSQNYPELKKGFAPNMSDYDTVFIGGPVWWYTMAPALFSFLKKTDFKGARVAVFSTQGSNYGQFFTDFEKNIQNAKIIPYRESFNNVDETFKKQVSNKINAWLNKLSRK